MSNNRHPKATSSAHKPSRHVNGHYARKRFGQNFLHDQFIISQIVDAVSPQQFEHIIEIGPGMGAITDPLLQQVTANDAKLTVLELDRDLASRLRIGIGAIDNKHLTIIETNALEFDFTAVTSKANGMRVVGNLPYNISTPLLFHLMQYAEFIADMHFMLQKEVVDRITAAPKSKTYGRLSVMMQYHAKPTFLFDVPKGAFNPPPKVTSAVFRLVPFTEKPIKAKDEDKFALLVRDAFNQRRKTLRAIFKNRISAEQMESVEIDPMARPETLSVAEFVTLANLVSE